MAERRNIKLTFDEISLRVVSYLESHSEVTGLQVVEKPPATARQLEQWEKENYPFRLPQDLKNFLLLSNGLLLRWYMNLRDELCPLGCMHVNAINQVKALSVVGTRFRPKDSATWEESDDEEADADLSFVERGPWAFDLDQTCTSGHMALVYTEKSSTAIPEVWFEDLSCVWNFVAGSFSDYFRAMSMHLGLPHWQYAYTDVGLDPVTSQWLRLLVPDRCSVDENFFKQRGTDGKSTMALLKGKSATKKKEGAGGKLELKAVEDAAAAILTRKKAAESKSKNDPDSEGKERSSSAKLKSSRSGRGSADTARKKRDVPGIVGVNSSMVSSSRTRSSRRGMGLPLGRPSSKGRN